MCGKELAFLKDFREGGGGKCPSLEPKKPTNVQHCLSKQFKSQPCVTQRIRYFEMGSDVGSQQPVLVTSCANTVLNSQNLALFKSINKFTFNQ